MRPSPVPLHAPSADQRAHYADVLRERHHLEREGRFALPVRADAHRRVDGIVLGTSSSGATLFIEPRQVTELGKYTPKPEKVKTVGPGETCYLVAAIKTLGDVRVGFPPGFPGLVYLDASQGVAVRFQPVGENCQQSRPLLHRALLPRGKRGSGGRQRGVVGNEFLLVQLEQRLVKGLHAVLRRARSDRGTNQLGLLLVLDRVPDQSSRTHDLHRWDTSLTVLSCHQTHGDHRLQNRS